MGDLIEACLKKMSIVQVRVGGLGVGGWGGVSHGLLSSLDKYRPLI